MTAGCTSTSVSTAPGRSARHHHPQPRGALRVRLVGNGSWADLRGPTACEVWTPVEKSVLEARLGPDPLRPRPRGDDAWSRLSRSRMPVGQLLMDQQVVAGMGNVYRAEVLFRAAMSPHRPGRLVRRDEWDPMWTDLVTLMKAGLRSGRIVTTRPSHRSRTGRVRREDAHYVYRRTGLPCRVCGTPIADRGDGRAQPLLVPALPGVLAIRRPAAPSRRFPVG